MTAMPRIADAVRWYRNTCKSRGKGTAQTTPPPLQFNYKIYGTISHKTNTSVRGRTIINIVEVDYHNNSADKLSIIQ